MAVDWLLQYIEMSSASVQQCPIQKVLYTKWTAIDIKYQSLFHSNAHYLSILVHSHFFGCYNLVCMHNTPLKGFSSLFFPHYEASACVLEYIDIFKPKQCIFLLTMLLKSMITFYGVTVDWPRNAYWLPFARKHRRTRKESLDILIIIRALMALH